MPAPNPSISLLLAPYLPVQAAGGIAFATPNLDELAAMASAAQENNRLSSEQAQSTPRKVSPLNGVDGGALLRVGHSLARAAIADGELVDARPLGPSLTAVLVSMLEADAQPASNGEGGGFGSGRAFVTHVPVVHFCNGEILSSCHQDSRQQAKFNRVHNVLSVPAEPQSTQTALAQRAPRRWRSSKARGTWQSPWGAQGYS